MIINLGAGKKIRADSLNVDITRYPGVDERVDLAQYPWPWADNSIVGIHVSHLLEHFHDQQAFILECHRILKPGGFLRIVGPHSSCVSSVGCLGHYRTYSYKTFDDYLGKPFYMFGPQLFKTEYERLNWWYEDRCAEGNMDSFMIKIVILIDFIVTPLINLNPRIFENWWWPFVGGAREVIWRGRKL